MTQDQGEGAVPEPKGSCGGQEQAFFFESGGRRLFACLHEPSADAPRGSTWVFCSPFGEERGFVQRLMVEWARALARAGHAVLRFDYRGYGDSEGMFEEFTAKDHVDDALAAVRELERLTGEPCGGLCGIRLGASIAALAARKGALPSALLLWDPVVNGDRYMDDLLRGTMAKEMANSGQAPRTRDALKEHLAAGGEVILEGHPLRNATYRSIAAIDLAKAELRPAGPCRVVQVSARVEQKVRRDFEALRQAFGAEVVFAQVPLPWRQNKEYAVSPPALFAPSLEWIRGLDAARPAPARVAAEPVRRERPQRVVHDGGTESLVELPSEGRTLRAVLHLPARVDPTRPAVVIVTPGFNCRTARYRLYVRLSRELARAGWASLRVDPHGIGDSDGVLAHTTVADLYRSIESGMFVADTRAAIEFLSRAHGYRSAILVGLCGGATTSIRTAAQDERVVGVVASELPFRFTPKPGSPEEENDERPVSRAEADHVLSIYKRRFFDLDAWRRFLTGKTRYRSLIRSAAISVAKRVWRGRASFDPAWYEARLGPRANHGLVAEFQRCIEKRLPLFCIFGATLNSWYFAEIQPGLLSPRQPAPGQLTTRSIEGADPGFSIPAHAREFLDGVQGWITSPERPWASATAPARPRAAAPADTAVAAGT